MGYKQVNQILRRDIASSTLTVRTTSQARNTAIECSDSGLKGNQTVDDSLAIRIMEVTREFFRGETALLDEIVYKSTDGPCTTGY